MAQPFMLRGQQTAIRHGISFQNAALAIMAWAIIGCILGCGTTRWTDTPRTATEQMLITNAIDEEIDRLDFRIVRGKKVYYNDRYLTQAVDSGYVSSSIRNKLLLEGCILCERMDEATYVVEARAGAVGTDRHDMIFGVPAVNVPSPIASSVGTGGALPEIPLIKRTDQMAVAKVPLFIYNRESGKLVWQSGIQPTKSNSKDVWVFGAGPFQSGSIRERTEFAGSDLPTNRADTSRTLAGGAEHRLENQVAFAESPSTPATDSTATTEKPPVETAQANVGAAASPAPPQAPPGSEGTNPGGNPPQGTVPLPDRSVPPPFKRGLRYEFRR